MADDVVPELVPDRALEAELEALLATARAQQSLIRASLITLTEYLDRSLPK